MLRVHATVPRHGWKVETAVLLACGIYLVTMSTSFQHSLKLMARVVVSITLVPRPSVHSNIIDCFLMQYTSIQ